MTSTALILNLLLGGLLVAALALGLRLDRRLKALRDSQAGFIKAVAELDLAAARTQSGLQQWRDATDEARELLHDRIEKAKVQAHKLEQLLNRPLPEPRAAVRRNDELRPIERLRAQVEARRDRPIVAPAAPLAAVSQDDPEARAEALAAAVLNLTPRDTLRSGVGRPVRLEPRSSVRVPAFDDDLFETALGGRS